MLIRPLTTASALAIAVAIAAESQAADVTYIEIGQAGLAQFTLVGEASGHHLSFTVPEFAASDILASLVVRDPAGGVVDLQTDTPGSARAALRGSPFEAGLPSDLASLLRALIGEEIELRDPSGPTRGRLVGIGAGVAASPDRAAYPTAMLLHDGELLEVVLVPGVRVDLPASSAGQISRALAQTGENTEDMRQFDLTLTGDGQRDIALSYVTEAPAWKNSYRLLLDEGRLQGWATLENLSGHDWTGIGLTLTTGAPVAYRSHLIAPSLIARPDIGDLLQSARVAVKSAASNVNAGGGLLSMMSTSGAGGSAESKHLSALASGGARAFRDDMSNGILRYELPERIDLGKGRTTNLLYLDAEIAPQIYALYRPLTQVGPVLLAVGFAGAQPLAAGVVSVQDSSGFVGDAPFSGSTAGQDVMLPVAAAMGADMVTTEKTEVRINDLVYSGGKLHLTAQTLRTTTYATPLPENVDWFRVEHPATDADLTAANAEVVRKTHAYQVTAPVVNGKGTVEILETYSMSRDIDATAKAIGRLIADLQAKNVTAPDRLTGPIDRAHDLLRRLETNSREVQDLQSRYDDLVTEQTRLRGNLEVVMQDALRARYSQAMSRTESRILRILDRQEELEAAASMLRSDLESLFRAL